MDISSIAPVASGMPGAGNLRNLQDKAPAEQRKIVAGQFEAILLRQFLNESVGSMMGGKDSAQGSVYGYLLTDTLAQKLSAGGGLGLSKVIEQQLTPRGEPAPAPAASKEGTL